MDVIYLVEVERRKDEIAQAEQYRLSRQLPRRNSPIREMYQRSLVRLGELLVTWGYQLQTHFATENSASSGVGFSPCKHRMATEIPEPGAFSRFGLG